MSASRSTLRPVTRALLRRRQGEPLPLVATVVARHQRLRAGLGVLHRLAGPLRGEEGQPLLRCRLQLAAESAADVRRDHPDLRLGRAGRRGQQEPCDVRDLGRGPHRDLLAGRVDHRRARLHERRDQPLLAVLPLDHDAVGARLLDRLVDVAARAALGGVERPDGRDVGAQVGVGEHLVRRGLLEVEGGRQLVVLHLDELGGVPRLRGAAAPRRRRRSRRRTPTRSTAIGAWSGVFCSSLSGHALAMTPWTSATSRPMKTSMTFGAAFACVGVDAGDRRVGERAAHHREVQHPGQDDVVRPPGAAR